MTTSGAIRLGLLWLGAMAASGCAATEWRHPNFGPEATQAANDECRQQAAYQAAEEQRRARDLAPTVPVRDAYGRIVWVRDQRYGSRSVPTAAELHGACMRAKGFRLVEVEKG